MATDVQKNIELYQKFFEQVTELLAKKSWFKKEKWIAQPHLFEMNGKAEAVSFHLFKKSWFNDDRQGIHFETFRDLIKSYTGQPRRNLRNFAPYLGPKSIRR